MPVCCRCVCLYRFMLFLYVVVSFYAAFVSFYAVFVLNTD